MITRERSMRRGSRTWIVFALLVFVASGCGGDSDDPVSPPPPPPPQGGLPASTPQANTPANLLQRFEATWEYEVIADYTALLTADFGFTFSSQADPELDKEYGSNWTRADEVASTTHLMAGFTDDEGTYQAPASNIQFSLSGVSIIADPDHPDSAAWYVLVIVPSFIGHIRLSDPGQTEYHLDSTQDFHLVRGDAAVLAPGQEPGTDRWYLRRWVDRAVPLAGPVILPARPTSWGRIKADYR
jgi:hypothetical protein